MNDEYGWRQLGTVVNTVLSEARLKAMRTGHISRVTPAQIRANEPKLARAASPNKGPHGFLSAVEMPKQLELPFGIAPGVTASPLKARAPRGVRLT